MSASLPGMIVFRAFTQGGTFAPLGNGWLTFYESGTTVFQAVYADAAQTIPLANPLQLDPNGQATFYLGAGLSYKIDLMDSNLVGQTGWPIDPVTTAIGLSAISPVTGSPNAVVMSLSAALVYSSGLYIGFNPLSNNTGAVTIDAGGGAVNLTRNDGVALASGDLVAGGTYTALYNANTNAFNLSQMVASQVQGLINSLSQWSTSGASPAFTLTPTPPISTYGGAIFYVKANAASGGVQCTLAISGLAATNVMVQGPAGSLVPAVWAAGQTFIVQYNGSVLVVLTPAVTPSGSGGRFRNLAITYAQSSASAVITADAITVEDANGNQTRLNNINVTAALTTAGAINGTDGSTLTANNFYAVYVIYNPTTGVVASLISSGYPAPTSLISGFTQYCRVGMNKVKAIGPGVWQPGNQNNDEFQIQVGSYLTGLPQVCTGTLGNPATPTWQIETVRGNTYFAPPTASRFRGLLSYAGGASGNIMLAPNNTYGAATSTTNPPPVCYIASSTGGINLPFDFLLETAAIYIASAPAATYVFALGWKDNL